VSGEHIRSRPRGNSNPTIFFFFFCTCAGPGTMRKLRRISPPPGGVQPQLYHQLSEAGQYGTGLSVAVFDLPTQMGYDPPDARPRLAGGGRQGSGGVRDGSID